MKKILFLGMACALLLLSFSGIKAQTVILQVDMTYQTFNQVSNSTGNFDYMNDSVDVAGSFNGWDGKGFEFTRTSDTAFVYADTISDLTVGDVIEYKLRINANWDNSEFPGGGANRKFTVRQDTTVVNVIYDNYYPGLVPVYISINMNKMIQDENFVDTVDFVDVAGSFNNWGGTDELWNNGQGIYQGMVLAAVGDMEWKTRINADWATSEFSGGGANRVYTVVDTVDGAENILETLWYDDDPLSLQQNLFADVVMYPNPFVDNITLNNLNEVSQVTMTNVVGQEISSFNVSNDEILLINTSDLNSGIYLIVLHDAYGNSRAMKVIKQ